MRSARRRGGASPGSDARPGCSAPSSRSSPSRVGARVRRPRDPQPRRASAEQVEALRARDRGRCAPRTPRLAAEIADLRTSPRAIERLAREQLGLARPDETVFLIREEDAAADAALSAPARATTLKPLRGAPGMRFALDSTATNAIRWGRVSTRYRALVQPARLTGGLNSMAKPMTKSKIVAAVAEKVGHLQEAGRPRSRDPGRDGVQGSQERLHVPRASGSSSCAATRRAWAATPRRARRSRSRPASG